MRREIRENSSQHNGKEDKMEEEVIEQEEEGETRCICGEIDPPDDSGLYIQCEQCSVWQHGYCVGITEGETPDKYWCEQCKPELHTIYITELNERRSHYKPIQQRRRKIRRNKRNSESEDEFGGLEASQQPNQRASGNRNMMTNGSTELDQEGNAELETVETNSSVGKHSMDETQKAADRKRATSSAREEKHYQLMLEKALRESRRASNDGFSEDEDELGLPTDKIPTQSVASVVAHKDSDSPKSNNSDGHDAANQPRKRGRTALSNKSTSPSESEEETRMKRVRRTKTTVANSAAKLQKNGERVGRGGRTVRAQHGTNSASSTSIVTGNAVNSNSEIGIHKPLKPRLPSQRTTLNEMRKRVNAILEFISRTQVELSEDKFQRDQLCQFIENREFVANIDEIFKNYDESYKKMDELTRQLLVWEQNFSAII